MNTSSTQESSEYWETSSPLDRRILSYICASDIRWLIRIACTHYGTLEEVYYDYARESPYFVELINGTLGWLIQFLKGFRNKPACGFAHEAKVILDGVKLEPENCTYQSGYTWCGHPELNGLLIAEVLAEYFLGQKYPHLRRTAEILPSIHKSRNSQDGGAAQLYANPALERNPDGSIPIHWGVRILQFEAGKIAEERCARLATALENAYV